jgi:hypothetical protein
MPRSAFEGLEPCDGKLSRMVLRGLGVSNDPRLPGTGRYLFFINNLKLNIISILFDTLLSNLLLKVRHLLHEK